MNAAKLVADVKLKTRGHMPETSKHTVGGRKWRDYLAKSMRTQRHTKV